MSAAQVTSRGTTLRETSALLTRPDPRIGLRSLPCSWPGVYRIGRLQGMDRGGSAAMHKPPICDIL